MGGWYGDPKYAPLEKEDPVIYGPIPQGRSLTQQEIRERAAKREKGALKEHLETEKAKENQLGEEDKKKKMAELKIL